MKTGLREKLKWLKKPDSRPAEPEVVKTGEVSRPGWFIPQGADELLATPLRQQLLKIIWQRTSVSAELFSELYQGPVARFAVLAQHFPASEYHHHAYPGGLLDHTLEVMAFAAKLRQRHLLPAGGAPEDQAREAEAWTAGVLYAALLHDAGKIVADIDVVTDGNQAWHPWQGAPIHAYQLKYRKARDYHLHPVAGSLLVSRILPDTAMNWLAQYPELLASFLYCISGHYERAGVLGELVQEADRASVAQFMGASAGSVLNNPQPSLAKQVLMALRELVHTRYKLNNPHSGSDGWLTGDALWLVSKTTADNIRAWLLQQGVTGVPDSNVRLFDEMQSLGLIVPTPEGKAIWSCEIEASSGWTPGRPLTLLRVSPERIWSDSDNRPAAFDGLVSPQLVTSAQQEDTAEQTVQASPEADVCSEGDPLSELALSLFSDGEDVIGPANNPSPGSHAEEEVFISEVSAGLVEVDSAVLPADDIAPPATIRSKPSAAPVSGLNFVNWLREGLQTRKILINDRLARVHMVDGMLFMVSPEIFKLYVQSTTGSTGDEWKLVQRAFQKLRLHYRGVNNINIHACQVKGPRKTSRVEGYLLASPEEIFGEDVPEDNPYLSVKGSHPMA
ncbi:MAG: MobH family relaxase [Scandinavium sp.]|uniref:MobH family relaxase n=1 Tax=Scandinavium sp. TaxID=2830653 RepID=UPI003F38DFC1